LIYYLTSIRGLDGVIPIKLEAEAARLQSAQVVIEAEPPCTPERFIPSITKDEKEETDKEGTETYPYL
jgi:hypothetical protein